MGGDDHAYAIELRKTDGTSLGQLPVQVDWEPAKECARLAAWRRRGPEQNGSATIRPLWHPRLREPYLLGFRATVRVGASSLVSSDFGTSYFRPLAQDASTELVKAGRLKEGEIFHYLVLAFSRDIAAPEPSPQLLCAEDVAVEPHIGEGSLQEALDLSAPWDGVFDGDLPVFVHGPILTECGELARAAGDRETGGILIGELRRDSVLGDLFAIVTAQVPARHCLAESMRLTFTPETWSHARSAMELRHRNEVIIGWWHSHPAAHWKQEEVTAGAASGPFFSVQDRALHRTVFCRAYSVALVVTESETGEQHTLYGWRNGQVEQRAFYVLDAIPAERPLRGGEEGGDDDTAAGA